MQKEIKKYVPFVESKPYCRCQQKGTWITCTESNICAMKQEGKPKYNRLDGLTLEEIDERGAEAMYQRSKNKKEPYLYDNSEDIVEHYLDLARAYREEFLK